MQCFGLPPERIQSGLVEIGGRKAWVPFFGETPWAIVKALARDVDIVGVENAVDEACDHVRTGKVGYPIDREF